MKKVKFLIDSASDVTQEEGKAWGVKVIPLSVRFGDEEYFDGVDILPEEFYDKLSTAKQLPQTSLVNSFRWDEAFKEVTKDGSEVVVITISSVLSGTYQAALEASKNYEGKVFVVDSLSAAIGERALLQYGMKLAENGLSASDIVKELNEKKLKQHIYAMVDTLKYLKMGGRMSAAVAFVGELLSIKPIIEVKDGGLGVAEKAKGNKKAFIALNSLVEKKGGIDPTMPCNLVLSGNDDTNMQKYLVEGAEVWKDCEWEVKPYMLGSVIGTHVGHGAVGISFFEK